VAVGNTVYYSSGWKTFPDFLSHYIKKVLGFDWGTPELQKPEPEMHPITLWYRRWALQQAAQKRAMPDVKPGHVFESAETGAARAYLDVAYNLYLLEHNAELRDVLVGRLKNRDQFLGALSELRVAGMLVRAGFRVRFHDESDGSSSHCEYDATRVATGKMFSVEVKTKNWDEFPTPGREGERKIKIHVGRLLRDALAKNADFDRIIVIELAMPDGVTNFEPWWMQAAEDGIAETEARLRQQGTEMPAAKVIICNHPYHFHLETDLFKVGLSLQGIGPDDFRARRQGTIREALRFREKHADMLALWTSIETHRRIPQTFNGESQHFAFGERPARLIIGHTYKVPDGQGNMVDAVLMDAVVIASEKAVHGIYSTADGRGLMCKDTLTEDELRAYAEHPDTFFGVVKNHHENIGKDPMKLFDFFYGSYGKSPKEALLRLLGNRPDIEVLRDLTQKDLAEIYCEGLVYGVMAQDVGNNRGTSEKTG
jgi:hypothetical protein